MDHIRWSKQNNDDYFIKIQNGLSFWCLLTQVVQEKRPLNETTIQYLLTHYRLINDHCHLTYD